MEPPARGEKELEKSGCKNRLEKLEAKNLLAEAARPRGREAAVVPF